MLEIDELTEDEDFLELLNLNLYPRIPRVIRERPNHFVKWRDDEFKNKFRLSKPVVRYLIDKISDNIKSLTNRNAALSPADMVFLTLCYLATGSMLYVAGDFSGIHKSTTSRAVRKVLQQLALLRTDYIEMPSTEDEIEEIRQGFYNIAKFFRCIGALDCTHVRIQSPGGNEAEIFRNRKGFFPLNVQAVCDANLIIRNIVCRWPGSAHDSTIFLNSRLKYRLEQNEFGVNSLLVGDSGYAVKRYLITPLGNPTTAAEQLFNEAQIRTRNPIERCFGLWKRRCPILALGIKLHITKVQSLVVAAAILHNIATTMGDTLPQATEEIEAAIELTNNVNLNNPDARHAGININNVTRFVLINQHFQHLLL